MNMLAICMQVSNMNDIKTIAREFVPESLVEQLAQAVSDLSFTETNRKEDSYQDSEESSGDEHSVDNKRVYGPNFKANEANIKQDQTFKKGKKINFDQLVRKVKKRLEKEIKKKIQIHIIEQNATRYMGNVSKARGRSKKLTQKSTVTTNLMTNLDLKTQQLSTDIDSASLKPRNIVHKKKKKESLSSINKNKLKNWAKLQSDSVLSVRNKQKKQLEVSNKRKNNADYEYSAGNAENIHDTEKENIDLINKNNRFKIKERKDLTEKDSFDDDSDKDLEPDTAFWAFDRKTKLSTPNASNKENFTSPREKINISEDVKRVIVIKNNISKDNENNRFKIKERINNINNNRSKSDHKKYSIVLDISTPNEHNIYGTTIKHTYYVDTNKKNTNFEYDDTSGKKVDKKKQSTLSLIEKKEKYGAKTSTSDEETADATGDRENKKTLHSKINRYRIKTERDVSSEKDTRAGSSSTKSFKAKKYKNNEYDENIPSRNNMSNEQHKTVSSEESTMIKETKERYYLGESKMAHSKGDQLEKAENSVSTEVKTTTKKTKNRRSTNNEGASVSPKHSRLVKVTTEDVYDDEYTISTIASSEIKGETHNLGEMDESSHIKIKPTIKLKRDLFKINTPNFVKKTTSYAEKYNFDEPIPENDRKREDIEDDSDPDGIVNKKEIKSSDEGNDE